MTRFTNNPLERMMTQAPCRLPDKKPTPPPKGHPCHGCKHYGESCVLPCYRGIDHIPSGSC